MPTLWHSLLKNLNKNTLPFKTSELIVLTSHKEKLNFFSIFFKQAKSGY